MLNNELLKEVGKKLASMTDWSKITGKPVVGSVVDMFESWALPQGLVLANEKFGDKIPEGLIEPLETALQCFVDEDYQGVIDALPEGIDQLVDIKQFDDELEAAWFKYNFEALVALVKFYAQKKAV